MLRTLEFLVFSPLLLCRTSGERQQLVVTFTNNFREIPPRQTETVGIEIKSKFLQVLLTY